MKKAVEFSAFDSAAMLWVFCWIYEVNDDGTFLLVDSGGMSDLLLGSYAFSFDADNSKAYIAKMRVYTDDTFTVLNTDYPAAGSVSIPPTYVSSDADYPTIEETKHGVVYANGAKTGEYRGEDLWQAVDAAYLRSDISVLQDGVTVDGTLVASFPVPSFRDRVDGLLALIGQSSLTDEELDDFTASDWADKPALYAALVVLLDSRGVTQASKDRLKYFFRAIGLEISDGDDAGNSNILLGAAL